MSRNSAIAPSPPVPRTPWSPLSTIHYSITHNQVIIGVPPLSSLFIARTLYRGTLSTIPFSLHCFSACYTFFSLYSTLIIVVYTTFVTSMFHCPNVRKQRKEDHTTLTEEHKYSSISMNKTNKSHGSPHTQQTTQKYDKLFQIDEDECPTNILTVWQHWPEDGLVVCDINLQIHQLNESSL